MFEQKIVLKNYLHLRKFLVICKFFKLLYFKPPVKIKTPQGKVSKYTILPF